MLDVNNPAAFLALVLMGVAMASAVRELVSGYPWPAGDALRVLWCESRGDGGAVNGYGHTGLFQISPEWHGWRVLGGPRRRITDELELAQATRRLLEPATNVAVAYAIWSESGWQPWGCRP
jgi:hypothetical protein